MVVTRPGIGTKIVTGAATMTLWTGTSLACPFCASAKTGNGYLFATVLLLAIPFVALTGFVLWLRRCARILPDANDHAEEGTSTP